MKKYTLFFSCILILALLSGCVKEEVDIDDVKVYFSVDQLLKNRLQISNNLQKTSLTNETLVSEGYYRLTKAFGYIEDLIWNINNTIENSAINGELNEGETVIHKNYKTLIVKENDRTKVTISNNEINQTLEIERTSENDKLIINGSNKINNNLFTFTFINNEELFINYHDELDQSDSYAHFIEENGLLKGTIVFNNSEYDYNLYAVLNEVNCAIYYDFISVNEVNRVFEVYDQSGNELYVSLSLKNNHIKGTGWHLLALNSIEGDEDENNADFHTIKMNYLTMDLQRVMKDTIILGNLSYNDDFSQIISANAPFASHHYQNVVNIAQKLNSYYKIEINK
ncbi:MAG: hypothetical protein K0Q49_1848 [Haloplasmataceae bacterium]|nr:hypothetical protein [Haloplasmataceae bacterium]